jgi:hypothetical protein
MSDWSAKEHLDRAVAALERSMAKNVNFTAFVTAAWEVVALQSELMEHRGKRFIALSDGEYDKVLVERIRRAMAAMRASHPT